MQQKKSLTVSRQVEATFPYQLYMPEGHEGKKLPLIVFLHGAGERGDGSNLDILKVHSIPRVFEEKAQDFPCIVVSPQCPSDTFWVALIPQLKMFIEDIIKAYPVDEDRVSLTGVSMGGYGTWFMAMAHPEMFSCIVPVCGGGMPWNAGYTLKMPVWAFHGECDTVVNPRESIAMIENLQKANDQVKLTLVPGVGHNAWDYSYGDEVLHWMIAHKR